MLLKTDFHHNSLGAEGPQIPLPIQAGHHPVEGPRELIFRAAAENGFRRTKDVLEFSGFGRNRMLSGVQSIDHIGNLAKFKSVLGTPNDFGSANVGGTMPIESSRDWVNFMGAAVRRSFLSRWRRVSPRRLRQAPVLHAVWALKPFGFDVFTRETLISACPRCDAKLCWNWAEDVTLCGACAIRGETSDMRDFCQPLVEFEDEKGVHFVADQIDPETMERRSMYGLHTDLEASSRGQLFQLAVKTAAAISGCDPGESIPVRAIERAGRAILHWPEGFEALFDENVSAEGAGRLDVGSRPLSRLTADRTLDRSLRLKISDLAAQRRRREVFNMRSLAPAETNMSPRGPRSEIVKLEASLRLAVPRALQRITAQQDDAQTIAAIMRDIKRCRTTAASLGLPPFELLELYEKGMLPELQSDIGHLAGPPVENAGTLQILLNAKSGQHSGIPLVRAASLLRGRNDVPWADVLAAIATGAVRAVRGQRKGQGILGELWTSDWDKLREVVSSRYRSPFLYTAVTHQEAAQTMGIGAKVVSDAVQREVLPKVLSLADITKIRAFWMFSFEVKDLFRMNLLGVSATFRALHKTRFERVLTSSFSLWRRSDIYSFLAQRVTRPQLPSTAMVL